MPQLIKVGRLLDPGKGIGGSPPPEQNRIITEDGNPMITEDDNNIIIQED